MDWLRHRTVARSAGALHPCDAREASARTHAASFRIHRISDIPHPGGYTPRIRTRTLLARFAACERGRMPYTLPQLRLLILLAFTLLVGLGVRELRAGFPHAAQRFERFDREDAVSPLVPDADAPPAGAAPREAPGR